MFGANSCGAGGERQKYDQDSNLHLTGRNGSFVSQPGSEIQAAKFAKLPELQVGVNSPC